METDILGREHYVKEILNYVDIKKNKVLCLNGEWGCGKTFIVKRLIEEMEYLNQEASKPYFPIYINAWEYDYYDEPLEGLILALYDYAFPKVEQVVKDKLYAVLSAGLHLLKTTITSVIKNKTGIDFNEINKDKELKKSIRNFGFNPLSKEELDSKSALKQTLYVIKTVLNRISLDRKIVIIVDDLDRCLPAHVIKTLERLHHIINESDDLMIVLALDKTQLSNTIKSIFGDCNVEKYLCKIVDGYINIDNGVLSVKFDEKYSEYFQRFSHDNSCISELHYVILNMIDKNIRNWEKKINEVISIHSIVQNEHKSDSIKCGKYDNSLLVAEILYYSIYDDLSAIQTIFYGTEVFQPKMAFKNLWKEISTTLDKHTIREGRPIYFLNNCCWHKVIELFVSCEEQMIKQDPSRFKAPYLVSNKKLVVEKMFFSHFIDHLSLTK